MKKFYVLVFLLILSVGVLLRFHQFQTWPRKGATFDEYAWTWQGINLIKEGKPVSWSFHPQYNNRQEIRYQQTAFIIVSPYLEHPPVFGLVAGGYAILSGVKDMYSLNLENIRGLALLLGALSIVLVFVLTLKLYDRKIALLTALLYSTIPTITIGSRLVQNENFFIPIWLAVLYLIHRYIKTDNKWLRNLAGILCGILMLAKVPWVAAALSICLIFLFYKRYRDIFLFLAIVIPVFSLYFLYGFFYDWDVFINLWKLQLNRYDITFTSIYALFQKPYLADRLYLDGWIFWGWISFFLLLVKDYKKNIFVVAPVIAYFLIFITGIPDEAGHGWYRYPFYPFLVISIALFLRDYFIKNYYLTFLFIVFVGSTLLQATWASVFGFSYIVFRLAIVSWGIILLPAFVGGNFKKLGNVVSFFWLILLFLLSICGVLMYNEQ